MNIYVASFKQQDNFDYLATKLTTFAPRWKNDGRIYPRVPQDYSQYRDQIYEDMFQDELDQIDIYVDNEGYLYTDLMLASSEHRIDINDTYNNYASFETLSQNYPIVNNREFKYKIYFEVNDLGSFIAQYYIPRNYNSSALAAPFNDANIGDLQFRAILTYSEWEVPNSEKPWWYDFPAGYIIHAGDVLKVSGDTNYFPAYLIAKEDYIITGDTKEVLDGNYSNIPPASTKDAVFMHFGVYKENGVLNAVNVINLTNDPVLSGGYNFTYSWTNPIDETTGTGASIWETCTPGNANANEMPWSFITEGVISDYISIQWVDGYNEVGSFSLVLPANDENLDLFKPDRYLLIENTEKIMVIETTKFNANLMSDGFVLQVSGRSLESILDRRVAFPGMALNTQAYKGDGGLVQALYDLVNAYFIDPTVTAQQSSDGERYFYYPERKVSFMELPWGSEADLKRPFNASINKNVVKQNILEVVTETCQNNNLGFKIIATPRFGERSRCITWKFVLYTGQDRSYDRVDKSSPLMIFSPTLGNVKAVATTRDSSNYRNVIFCGTERDSDSYIDLTATQDQTLSLSNLIELPAAISSIKNKITNQLQKNPVTYTGILILAIAGSKKSKAYTATIESITDRNSPSILTRDEDGDYMYPTKPITAAQAANITVTFYKVFGNDETVSGSTKRESFIVSDIENTVDASDPDNPKIIKYGFKGSTAFGWLTTNILNEATSGANSLPSMEWTPQIISNLGGVITKKAIVAWFRSFDAYTSNSTMTKWLCQTYDRSSGATGIDRKEVFVEQSNEQDDEWDTSAINAWRSSTTLIKTNSYDDEDSDEKINEKLTESARKQSGEYNRTRDVDVDIDYTLYDYMADYDLGDIVQVDDGYGNVDTYMITGVTIANDTSDGEKIVPTFAKYELIPSAYTPLEYIRVANMFLPVIYCPRENIANNDEDANWGTTTPDIGPDRSNGYRGYINEIFWERRSKWTEFEFEGGYTEKDPNAATRHLLHPNFALLSAVGYSIGQVTTETIDDEQVEIYTPYEELLPYALISSTIKDPLTLGRLGGAAGDPEAEGNPYYDSTRWFYQFIGDYFERYSPFEYETRAVSVPGVGIKWSAKSNDINFNPSATPPSRSYLNNAIYRVQEVSQTTHTFYINKAVKETGAIFTDLGDSRELRYSKSWVDSIQDSKLLCKRPQFEYCYCYSNDKTPNVGYTGYIQRSEWDYGHTDSADYFYNGYTFENMIDAYGCKNPWYKLITNSVDATALANITGVNGKDIALTNFPEPQAGCYGQVSIHHTSINIWGTYKNQSYLDLRNNANYRYMVLGGLVYFRRNGLINGPIRLMWHNSGNASEYTDSDNGVVVNRLKVYEYESAYKDYRWSEYELDDQTGEPTSTEVQTPIVLHDDVSLSPSSVSFRHCETGVENVDISTRHIVHDYIPVKYVDIGEQKLDDVEVYGLYDTIQQEFIPVNFCPNPEYFGSIKNDNAFFIAAGGERARE